MDEDNVSNEPVKKFRVGSVTAAVWKSEHGYSVTLQKSYRDENGTWQNTTSLFQADVVCAMRALDRAERYISQ